jgi:ABC-type bacteriocin/lantibiotic exporter with double-glycine peptidase domain
MSDSKTSSGGVGFAGLLTIAFVVLKLCKMIDWPWMWVVSPIWISIGLVLLFMGIIGLYYLLKSYKINKEYEARRKEREAKINEIKDRVKQVHESIAEGKAESRWQQRMNEMSKRQEAHK